MKASELFYGTNIAFADSFMNEKKCYDALTVVKGMEKFVDDNFRALVEITADVPDDATLFVSVESVALFFTEILNVVFGRAILKINFYVRGGRLYVHMMSDPKVDCSFDEAARLIRMARDVGFDFVRDEDSVLLFMDCYPKTAGTIYAPLVKDGIKRIAEIFENAYYSDKLKKERKDF